MIVGLSGGSGFIGQSLLSKLINLETVTEIRVLINKTDINPHKKLKKYRVNLLDKNLELKDFFRDIVVFYNCASEINCEELMYSLHVNSLKKMIKAIDNKSLRWVQLSSAGVYGNHKTGMIEEYSPINPANEYEKTKALADFEIQNTKLSYIILRPSILFGNGARSNSLLNLLKIVKKGFFIRIGKQNTILNYVSIDDLINAMIECGLKNNIRAKIYILSQKIYIEDFLDFFSPYSRNHIFLPKVIAIFLSFFLKYVPKFNLTKTRIDALTSIACYNGTKILQDTNFNYENSLLEQLKKYDSTKT